MRTKLLAFKVTEQEKERIEEAVERDYSNISAWVRKVVLDRLKHLQLKD